MRPQGPEGTVGELIEYLGPGLLQAPCLGWPPDVFAVVGAVLRRSGAYVRILDLPLKEPSSKVSWPIEAQGLAAAWRDSINMALAATSDSTDSEGTLDISVPARLQSCWETLRQSSAVPLAQVVENDSEKESEESHAPE